MITTQALTFNQSPVLVEDEYQALLRALRRKRGFGIFFVECDPVQSARVAQRLQADLADQRVQCSGISASSENLYEQIKALWQNNPFDILLLQGLERNVLAFEDSKHHNLGQRKILNPFLRIGVPPILHHLNQQRERFRDLFPVRFVLFLPPFLVDYFIQQAPDFFDWRSGLFRIPRDPSQLNSLAQKIIDNGDFSKYANQTIAIRNQQILEIEDLLKQVSLVPQNQAGLLFELGSLYVAQNLWEDAISAYKQSLQIKYDLGDTLGYSTTLMNLGTVYYLQNRWKEAIAVYEESFQIKWDLGDIHGLAEISINLGNIYYNQGQWDRAIFVYQEALRSFNRFKDTYNSTLVLNNIGLVYRSMSRWDDAIANHEQSLEISRETGNAYGISQSLMGLGLVYADLGRWDVAIATYEESLQIKRELGDTYGVAEVRNNLGLVYTNQGRWEDAIEAYKQSLQVFQELKDTYHEEQTLMNIGILYKKQGKLQ